MLEIHRLALDITDHSWQMKEGSTREHTLLLITYGKVYYYMDKKEYLLEKGDFIYYPPGTLRSGDNVPGEPHHKFLCQFSFHSEHSFDLPEDVLVIRTRNFDFLRQRFTDLNQLWFADLANNDMICQGIALELMGRLIRESEMEHISIVKLRLMEKVRDYIMKHYREPIRITDLSVLIDRAPNYVTRTFTEIMGQSPIAYMHQLRIQTACHYIFEMTMTMGELSEYLGYSDQAHFTKTFKKIMGHPPSGLLNENQHKPGDVIKIRKK